VAVRVAGLADRSYLILKSIDRFFHIGFSRIRRAKSSKAY